MPYNSTAKVIVRDLVQLRFEQLYGVSGMPAGADEIDDLQPDVRISGQQLVHRQLSSALAAEEMI